MTETFRGIITADGKKRQLPYNAVFGTPVSDPTLSLEGAFADSKAVGDKFKKVKTETDSIKEDKADKTALAQTDRKLDALWKLNQGISYEFQTDDTEAYQKTVPSGAKMVSIKSIGGKTTVWNQMISDNTGELMSAPVNEVVEQGKNLMNYDAWKVVPITRGTAVFEKDSFTLTATENDCYTEPMTKDGFPDDAKIEISEGETVTLSWESSADIDGLIYIYPNGVTDGLVYTNNHSAKALTYTATRGIKFITFRFGVSYAGNTVSYKNIQIEKKAKATSYEPYHRTTHAIPQSILQLDGYGESGNFVDFVEKKYHKGDRTIDISDIIGDTFQEPLEVEAGGTLIFKNSHGDDYRIPVPSSEEYVISLAEVAK